MTSIELAQIFRKEVSRPTTVEGDSWGPDATTEDILRLTDSPPDNLKPEDISGYLGYCTTGGDDDLRFLFPSILHIWASEVYGRDGWFTQYFHAEVCRTDFTERALSPTPEMKIPPFEDMKLPGDFISNLRSVEL